MSFLKLKTSLLENVDGSCELSTVNSKVIVSVTGPIEPKQRQEMPQQLALEVIIKPSAPKLFVQLSVPTETIASHFANFGEPV